MVKSRKNSYRKIKKIEMIYGKNEITNSYKKPFFDWLPHPLALMVKYFGYPKKLPLCLWLELGSLFFLLIHTSLIIL